MTSPQLRCEDVPHLPDSSTKSTSRYKRLAFPFFGCKLENGPGNPAETSYFGTLTTGVVRKEVAVLTKQELTQSQKNHLHQPSAQSHQFFLNERRNFGLGTKLAQRRKFSGQEKYWKAIFLDRDREAPCSETTSKSLALTYGTKSPCGRKH